MPLELRCSHHPAYRALVPPRRYCPSCQKLWVVKSHLRALGAKDVKRPKPLTRGELLELEEAREKEILETMSE